jgi:Flp pilus assembly pilin Flp
MKKLQRLMKEEEGKKPPEYALLAALVILTGIALWSAFGHTIAEKISQLIRVMGL